MADSLKLLSLGVGDRHTVRHNFSQLVLNMDGRHIFIECPAYVRKTLEHNNAVSDYHVQFEDLQEVFVSHVHADNIAGLEELSWYQAFGPAKRVKLYGPAWLLEDVWSLMKPAMNASTRFNPMLNPWLGGITGEADLDSPNPPYWPYPAGPAQFDWYFDYTMTRGDETVEDFEGFTVECMSTRHLPRALAFKFDFGNFKLGYSADTGYFPKLIEWLDSCDLVLHEVTFSKAEEERNLHTSIEDLLNLPGSFQEKTLLFHYPDNAYEETPDKPSYDIGEFRLLAQNRLYELL